MSHNTSISLDEHFADFLSREVASGRYRSASEVVRAGLRALQERNAAVERWLRDEVAPVYDAMETDPGRALAADEVFGSIRERHAKALAGRS